MAKSPALGKRPAALALALAAVTIALPIALAILVANQHAREYEIERTLALAHDIVGRSERTADQVDVGINRLVANQGSDPCSDSNRQLMWQIALSSSSLQAIGYLEGNRLVCSSLFGKGEQFDLGPPAVVEPSGVKLRDHVTLPFAGGTTFIVIERDHYAAVINKAIPIDVTTHEDNLVLATVSRTTGQVLTSRGALNPEWLQSINTKKEDSFISDGYVVAVVQSPRYYIDAVAAVPTARLDERIRDTSFTLVPIGLAAGVILFLVLNYLLRLQTALPAVIRAAMKRNEFFVEYQPVVDLSTGQWTGAEALVRWRRSSGDLVRPDVFVPVAEDNGLMPRLTERVITLVRADAAGLFQRFPQFHLAINLSSSELHSQTTVDQIRRFAVDLGAGKNNLVVEVTERGFMGTDTADVLHALRSAGVQIAIDDFGTGYSSLAYLEEFEVDFLKIDKSFVETVGTDAATSHVIGHIIEMAKSLNLEMIAEGVETEEQAAYLRERGVQYAQGWLFGKPMRFAELMAGMVSYTSR